MRLAGCARPARVDVLGLGVSRARDAEGAVGGLIHLRMQMDKTGAQAQPVSKPDRRRRRGMRPESLLLGELGDRLGLQYDVGDLKIDRDADNIDNGCHEWAGHDGGIEAKTMDD